MANVLDFESVLQTEKELDKIIAGQRSNDFLAGFCDELAEWAKTDGDYKLAAKYKNRALDFRYCHNTMIYDHYKQQAVMDFQRTFRCHDRFCPLCAKDRANTREFKMNKVIEHMREKYDLFHLTFTLRHCVGSIVPKFNPKHRDLKGLKPNLKQMSKCFQKLNRYLTGNAKIRDVDFSQYGYAGAIRALEIVPKEHSLYHPHYHCIIALKKGIELPGENYNKFSWDEYTKTVTPFSDFEILMQKIWYLIMNNTKVTKDVINELKQGYSCRIRQLGKNDYHQTFKYVIKPVKDVGFNINSFQDLDDALFGMRSVQCYGCFHGLKLSDEDIDDETDTVYDNLIDVFKAYELPVLWSGSPKEVREQIIKKKIFFISRKRVRAFVRKHGLEDDIQFVINEPERIKKVAQMMMSYSSPGHLTYFDGKAWVKLNKEQYTNELQRICRNLDEIGL